MLQGALSRQECFQGMIIKRIRNNLPQMSSPLLLIYETQFIFELVMSPRITNGWKIKINTAELAFNYGGETYRASIVFTELF